MTRRGPALAVLGLLLLVCALPARAQRPDPAQMLAAQREALAHFAMLDGIWRGPAWMFAESGERQNFTQTERVGPMLDGSIRIIEGRAYDENGAVAFNALGIISYDPATKSYSFHSHAQGHVGDFAVTPTANGFTWEIPAGPMTIRYTMTFKDGTWTEVGDRIMPGKDAVRFFEMNLQRVGDTDWPAGGAVPMK